LRKKKESVLRRQSSSSLILRRSAEKGIRPGRCVLSHILSTSFGCFSILRRYPSPIIRASLYEAGIRSCISREFSRGALQLTIHSANRWSSYLLAAPVGDVRLTNECDRRRILHFGERFVSRQAKTRSPSDILISNPPVF
jgi:hypothetical protein